MRYAEVSTEETWFHLIRETANPPVIARFSIPGEPVSKARARFTSYGSRTRTYTPQKTLDAERAVLAAFREAAPDYRINADDTYGVTAIFFAGTRQRRDVDNMLKLILDGLNGHAWVDDTSVIEVSGRKALVTREHAGTEVVIYRAGSVERPQKECLGCGGSFDVFPGTRRSYCGRDCANAAKRKPRPKCNVCGEPVSGTTNRYCSQACAGKAKRKPPEPCPDCDGLKPNTTATRCRPCYLAHRYGPLRVTITITEETAA